MKSSILLIAILIAFFSTLLLLNSCHSTKKTVEEKVSLILLLKARQGEEYIATEYARYQPTDIKRSNRTLNEYRVNFTCNEKAKAQLMEALEADLKVLKVRIAEKSGVEVSARRL